MGGDNFFAKLASADPIARTLGLPGANKYAQAVAQRNAGATDVNGGPFQGIAPTLAAANDGYTANAAGAPANWQQVNLGSSPSGIFGFAQKAANLSAATNPNLQLGTNPMQAGHPGAVPGFSLGNPYAPNGSQNVGNSQQPASAYVQAARGAAQPQTWGG